MRKSYFYGAISLGLILTACSENSLVEPGNGPLEADQTFYVNMTIHGDNMGTRAAKGDGTPVDNATESDFEAGTGTESKINNAYFVFYDKDGLVVGDIVPVDLNSATQAPGADGTTVETVYKSVVGVSVRKGENPPEGVICYVNPVSPSSLQTTLAMIQTVTRERVTTPINNETIFPMSNSVYYLNNQAGTLPQVMVPINKDKQLFTTEQEALNSTEAEKVVNIYVERYATKLKVTAEGEGMNVPYETRSTVFTAAGVPAETPATVVLTFNPSNWALNAETKTSYVIKSFRRESADGQILADNYNYGLLNYRINPADPMNVETGTNVVGGIMTNGAWTWNAPAYHRSYWGMSPAYFQDTYPEVASDVAAIGASSLQQTYLTYNQVTGSNGATKRGYSATDADPKYFKETTVGNKALNGPNPAAAVASVIYVGKYTLSVNGTDVADDTNFYTYLKGNVTVDSKTEQRPYVYFESNEDGNSAVTGGESMLKRFCYQSTILFAHNEKTHAIEELGIENSESYKKMTSCLAVQPISQEVKDAVSTIGTTAEGQEAKAFKLQANAVSLQITTAEAAQAADLLIASGNGYKHICADNVAEDEEITDAEGNIVKYGTIKISKANAILMQQVGFAYKYTAGMAYFNVPVRHYGYYRTGNPNNTPVNGTMPAFNWRLVRVGDFGMVRNHSYDVKINSITGLASGIANASDPIVPPAATEDYYVSYSVNILKWAVVPQQVADL